jgi:hypothetical protein
MPSGTLNHATDPPGPDHGDGRLRAPRTARRTHRAPTTGTDAFGRPEPRDGPTGPRPTGKGSFGSPEPRRQTRQGPAAIGSLKATDPRAGDQTAKAARQRDRRRRRASSEVRRCLPDGALGRPPTRPTLGAHVPSGSANRGADSAATPGWQASRRHGRTPRGPSTRRTHRTEAPRGQGPPGHASDADSTRFGGATKRPNPWPALCGPSGPRGAATRHSSERRREGIRTSLGPSPREYRAVCQWKRRQTRNGLRSGAMP